MSFEPIFALLLCTDLYVGIHKLFIYILVGNIFGGNKPPPLPPPPLSYGRIYIT